ncbi:g1/s-specific cyclin c [Globomyces pollinis-pini]|nr:g1/s-specific cyclin c [Globomyces pollinis-pini]
MSADFWNSSKEWLLSIHQLQQARSSTLKLITEQELVKLDIYYSSVIHHLARSISHRVNTPVRQRAIASALVYFKRFYTKNPIESLDPLLVCATCLYLACKADECPVHIKSVVNEMKHLHGSSKFPYEANHIAEFEFYLLEDLNFFTVVYHPYRPLKQFLEHLKLDTNKNISQHSNFVINDIYRTDLCLMHPPYIIALTSLYVICAIHRDEINQESIIEFFNTSQVDMQIIVECAQILFNLYADWGDYCETQVPAILSKLNLEG